MNKQLSKSFIHSLAKDIKVLARELGFSKIGIVDVNLSEHEKYLEKWLKNEYHGNMKYMEKHGKKRSRPEELVKGTKRIITVSMNYISKEYSGEKLLEEKEKAFISSYALGRDYHNLMKARLLKLAKKLKEAAPNNFRVFVDSAPVLEKAIAQKAGIGWIGKNTLLLNKEEGSYFFLGEIYTDLELPLDSAPVKNHCGTCTACLDVCPTKAFKGPMELDARKCISYLTIENKESIPKLLRPLLGNRIFGCDDCQIYCPWNKFAKSSEEKDFKPRHLLNNSELIDLFLWTEEEFLTKTEGSAIRRAGYEGWLRNIAVALGNAKKSRKIISALNQRINYPSELVREHVNWALDQHLK